VDQLVSRKPYRRLSSHPRTGLAPTVEVEISFPVSGRRVGPFEALVDTGAVKTMIYKRDVEIDFQRDVDRVQSTGEIYVSLQIRGKTYHCLCIYGKHPHAGTEQILLGMDVLQEWLVELNGPDKRFTVHAL